jgi:integrase
MLSNKINFWIVKKRNKYTVIRKGDRKQFGKSFTNKVEAERHKSNLIRLAAIDQIVEKEHFFKEIYLKFALEQKEKGDMLASKLTRTNAAAYLGVYNNYIKPAFPNIYLHQVDSPVLEKFVEAIYKLPKPATYKTARRVIEKIKRFLRYCLEKKYHHNFESALNFKLHTKLHLVPDDDELRFEKKTKVISPVEAAYILNFLYEKREENIDLARAYIIFNILYHFGLRISEISGIRKSDVDLAARLLKINGVFDFKDNVYRNRTKNRASKRDLAISTDASQAFDWWLNYLNKYSNRNEYLIPAKRGSNPLSSYKVRKIIYMVYELVGLAKIKWIKSGNTVRYQIISCAFRSCPSKTWRHLKGTQLIDSMPKLNMTPNYVKKIMGHSRFSTTQDRYGNHVITSSDYELEISEAFEKSRKESFGKLLTYPHAPIKKNA